MMRISLLGSDSSHALEFAKLVNFEDHVTGKHRFENCRITCIYGTDREQTLYVAKEGGIPAVAERPEDLLGQSDAVMVVCRDGDLHAGYAAPFLNAGIPTFVDKPFTIRMEDAGKLLRLAAERKVLLTGGSGCRAIGDVQKMKVCIESGRAGEVHSAIITFRASYVDEYGGLPFYGSHAVEIAGELFGYRIRAITARRIHNHVTATLEYDDFHLVLNLIADTRQYGMCIFGNRDIIFQPIRLTDYYIASFGQFYRCLNRGHREPPEHDRLYASVQVMGAITDAVRTGRATYLTRQA